MGLYSRLAENLQFVSPTFYKSRFFKKLKNLSRENVLQRSVEPELLWIKEFLSKDDVFMDVGANVGAYIFLLENHLKPENIFAFEPNPQLFRRLKRLFPKINLNQIALSDVSEVAEFKIPVINGKKVHSRGTLQTEIHEKNEENTIRQRVVVQPLDSLNINFKRLDFIKIDVEGNEMQTLRGAKKTIANYRPTLMVEMEQRHHRENLWTWITEIESWSYSAHYLCRDNFRLEKLTQDFLAIQNSDNLKIYEHYINNIIFLPSQKVISPGQ